MSNYWVRLLKYKCCSGSLFSVFIVSIFSLGICDWITKENKCFLLTKKQTNNRINTGPEELFRNVIKKRVKFSTENKSKFYGNCVNFPFLVFEFLSTLIHLWCINDLKNMISFAYENKINNQMDKQIHNNKHKRRQECHPSMVEWEWKQWKSIFIFFCA